MGFGQSRRHPMGGRYVMVLNVSLIGSFGQTNGL